MFDNSPPEVGAIAEWPEERGLGARRASIIDIKQCSLMYLKVGKLG